MKTEQIKLSLAIARTGSVSKAAEEFFISQPTASVMLKSLEKEVGFAIFNRTPYGMTLTDEGSAFIEYAGGIERLLQSVSQIKTPKKHVRLKVLSMGHPFSEHAFSRIYEEHLSDNSVIDLGYRIIPNTEAAFKALENGNGDVAVVPCKKSLYESVSKSADKKQFITVPVGDTYLELTCISTHPLIQNGTIHYDLLGKYPCFSGINKANAELYTPFSLARYSIEIPHSIEMLSVPVRYALLRKTNGYLISTPIPEDVRQQYGFTSLPVENADITMFAVYRRKSRNENLILQYIEYCRSFF